jgi:P27 family predicted phage terminase small subunit
LEGDFDKNPQKQATEDVAPEAGRPDRPLWLSGLAVGEWDRVTREMEATGVLTLDSQPILELYCVTYALWRTAAHKCSTQGEIIQTEQGVETNPYVQQMNKHGALMVKLLGEMGLTPATRARVQLASTKPAKSELESRFLG